MCAINPKHKKRILLDVYTSHPTMTKEQFDELVTDVVIRTELQLNTDEPLLRWHIKETTQEAD